MTAFFERIAAWPVVFDQARAADALQTLQAAFSRNEDLQPAARLLADDGRTRDLLAGTFSGSSYLTSLALRDPALVADCLLRDPDEHIAAICADLAAAMGEAQSVPIAMTALRRCKRHAALLIGLADLGHVWETATVLDRLSTTADAVLEQAVRFLFRRAREAGQLVGADANGGVSGYFVIAMGKLGAFELNYSSDIDLIVFYEAAKAGLAPDIEPSTFFVRLTRELLRLLQEHTGDGYAYRTDLRLRPDPGATQIALSTDAAFTYYESFGQNWERAALIKARVAAGDVALGETFLRQLSPFIWRRYLDYAAIADIHAMKRRVHAFKGHASIAVAGHDIKLGRGGIRDIEFFAQTQQLVLGGRRPELRTRGTIQTLDRLAAGGWITPEAAGELTRAYYFFRAVENRLQMIADEQTHLLPKSEDGLKRVAALTGFAETSAFSQRLRDGFETVEVHYNALFEKLPVPASTSGLVFTGKDEAIARQMLERLGFRNPMAAIAAVTSWQSGRYPSTRSTRARERLAEFLPLLLEAFSRTAEPDLALGTFDRVIAAMPAGVQPFSLLAANPSLLRLIADIMGTAPRLATTLGKRPRLLDATLDPGFFEGLPTRAALEELVHRALAQPSDYQDALDRARIVGREQAFLIGVHVLSGAVTAMQAGAAYTDLVETLIAALQARVEEELVSLHGRVPGGQAAVIAMGKLGGREMTAGSDLDLILVYDFAGENVQSDGARPLPASQYYMRLTQRLISALSAPTAEGLLYQVDLRLRPSGNQGPVATKLSGFIDYQRNSAWTWEHLALTRARVITGAPELKARIEDTIRGTLTRRRDREAVAADVKAMRARIAAEKGTSQIWDLKQVRGGLVDLEFIAQFLQLVSAAERPEVLDQTTETALAKLTQAGILAPGDAEILMPAARLYNTLTQVLRLCVESTFVPEDAPRALKDLLARATGLPDFATLEVTLKETLEAVHESFERLVR